MRCIQKKLHSIIFVVSLHYLEHCHRKTQLRYCMILVSSFWLYLLHFWPISIRDNIFLMSKFSELKQAASLLLNLHDDVRKSD